MNNIDRIQTTQITYQAPKALDPDTLREYIESRMTDAFGSPVFLPPGTIAAPFTYRVIKDNKVIEVVAAETADGVNVTITIELEPFFPHHGR